MRLHQLRITAFGPFADTVEVDFDALASGGLFLLTGATGAGKSSVLDAVCFALYGQVPGERAGAKHLHSDHAPPDRAPEVVLELSVGERRFRFTRSPAWSRPKRRGTGTTNVPAHVLVEERQGSGWVGLTNRLDDAGLLVGDLLGMSCSQFTQVAMLPQGRFQAFLRASSAERHAVLQQLFRTDRFERVERWLAERRTADRRASEAAADDVRKLLHRIEEASATDVPADWADALALAADEGAVQTWSQELVRATDAEVTDATVALAAAESAEEVSRELLARAQGQATLVRRAAAANTELAVLAQQADALLEAQVVLERHRMASSLRPLVSRSHATEATRADAQEAWSAQLITLRDLFPSLSEEPSRKELLTARKKAASALATAEAFLPRERELFEGEAALRESGAALVQAEQELAEAEAELEALPAKLAEAVAAQERAAAAVNKLAGAEAEVARLEELMTASTRLAVVTEALEAARAELRTAIDIALTAKEHYLGVREARIKGMAAELAGDLAAGCGCPVCGSVVHPAPALRSAGAVSREQEAIAESASVDADFTRQTHEVKVAGLEAERASLAGRLSGVEPRTISSDLDQARTAAMTLATEAADAERFGRLVSGLRSALAETTGAAETSRIRRTALRTEVTERDGVLTALRAERLALLGDRAIDVEALIADHTRAIDALDRALADLDALSLAVRTDEDARLALRDAALAAGFDDVNDALAALLDPRRADQLEQQLTEAETRRIAAESTLADPEVRAALEADAPDLARCADEHERAAKALRTLSTRTTALRERAHRLEQLDARLAKELAAWEPLRARHRLSAEVAALADGTSRDNPLKMRLAAYVLAERLRQVVAAANERLSKMTGERYALEHVADRGVGELRGGLSLRVRDDWNGVHRDPATLSGGETFVVSLALALGLADTVAHEAGGTDIDTLFIDEGFGSLDPDTLEDVMDTLDSLRDSGRVVGLVSHVPELRNRITTQLEVVKGRGGPSTLRQVLAGN